MAILLELGPACILRFDDLDQENQITTIIKNNLWQNSTSFLADSYIARNAVFEINTIFDMKATSLGPVWKKDVVIRKAIYGLLVLWSNLLVYSEKNGKEATLNFIKQYPRLEKLLRKYFSVSNFSSQPNLKKLENPAPYIFDDHTMNELNISNFSAKLASKNRYELSLSKLKYLLDQAKLGRPTAINYA